jgi:hypothetical protein
LASSILPDFGFDDFLPYHSISGNPMPSKILTSTSGLSAYNFQEMETRLTSTPLFSLFKGFIATPFTPVLLDCGASACTSPSLDAFEPDSLTPLDKPVKMEGIGGNVDIKMQGIVKYQTLDDNGNPFFLRFPAYYAPHIKQSLFSPQILFMTSHPKAHLKMTADSAVLHLADDITLTLHLDLKS